jgi:transcriptional regulator with XRE-family HTH domain
MVRTPRQAPQFGAELRRLRTAAGLSTFELGELIHFSKGYISKVETGQKSPSPHFVRMADTALKAGGQLIALASEQAEAEIDTANRDAGPPVPTPQVGVSLEGATTRRADAKVDEAEAKYSLETFESILAMLRDLGQTLNPSAVVDMLKPHIPALQDLATRLEGPLADKALLLAAHFADFTSWMTQETGDDVTALRWVDNSAALAEEANDNDMVANSYLRRANIALYQQDAYGTITFARQAQAMECGARVQGLAALREAQGHALAGDYEAFTACMDRAVALSARSAEERSDRPVIGPTKIPNPVALAKGWSLYDLGRSTEAIEVLEPLLEQTPKERSRAWARIASRLALALASVREVDRACDLTKEILALSPVVQSATIRSDLRQLSKMLNRWSSNPAVRAIRPHLSAALLPTAGGRTPPPRPVPGR